jgi:endo-1,4-beta-D-glucanase Y
MRTALTAAAIALCALASGARAELPYFSETASSLAPDGGCVVDAGRVAAVPQAHFMMIALAAGDQERFEKAAQCARDRLQGGNPAALPAALYGPDPNDGTEKVLDPASPTEASVLMAWSLLEAGEAFGGGYAKQGMALLSTIKGSAVQEGPLGRLLSSTVPQRGDGFIEVAPAALPPFALSKFCKADSDFCAIRQDSLRAVSRGSGQGYVPDRVTFTLDGQLAILPQTAGSDEAARFWHYVSMTSRGDQDRALLLSRLGRLGQRLDHFIRPPRREFMHPRTEEGMGSASEDASAAGLGSFKSQGFLGAASAELARTEGDPLSKMIMIESLWFQDRLVELDQNGDLKKEAPSK